MNKLQHSDSILSAKKGQYLMVCENVYGVNMREGGQIEYRLGDRLRVKFATGDILWCHDTEARNVTFSREDVASLEMER